MNTLDPAQQRTEEGRTARNRGDLQGALEGYEAAAALLRAMDAPLRLAHTIRHIADIQSHMGQLDGARSNYAEALALYRGNLATGVLDLANTLRGYALLMEQLSDPAAASDMWQEARILYKALGIQPGVDEADRRIALLGRSIP